MGHPEIDSIKKNISQWIQENFKKATLEFHVNKDEFSFARVDMINKVWAERDYWIVDAVVEYALGEAKMGTMTFQIDKDGKILGYNLNKPKMSF